MVTYEQSDEASDLSPSWANTTLFDNQMSTSELTSEVNFSVPAGTTRSASFITPSGVPNSDDWEDAGSWTVEFDVSAGDMDVTCRVRVVRLNSTGTILESGTYTSTQTFQASRTFTPSAPTWSSSEACGNRIAIELELVETGGHSAGAVTLNVGVTTSEVIADITHDAGTCGGPSTAVQDPIMRGGVIPFAR
jgi:hypothetical protein